MSLDKRSIRSSRQVTASDILISSDGERERLVVQAHINSLDYASADTTTIWGTEKPVEYPIGTTPMGDGDEAPIHVTPNFIPEVTASIHPIAQPHSTEEILKDHEKVTKRRE